MSNKFLYPCFDHWFKNGGTVFFYSDPHFNDDEMKYLRENYIGDEEQVKRINSKVGRNDTLVILGDIGDIEWVRKLRGYKVLIMGNHDAGASNYKRISQPEQIEWERHWDPHFYTIGPDKYRGEYVHTKKIIQEAQDNHLFDEVYQGTLQLSPKLMASHEPVDYRYCVNIHGHDHSHWHKDDGTHINVCAENIDYYPMPLSQIIKSGILKNIPDIHRETIDRCSKKMLDI